MLRMIAKLLRALNSEASPLQLSAGFALGMIIGLTPVMRVHNLVVLLLAFGLRINLSAFLLSWVFFSGIAYLFDPWFERLGAWLLHHPALQGLWTSLYQSDLWQLTHFNHTLTLGSLVVALLLSVPLLLAGRALIIRYRRHVMTWIERSRLLQLLRTSRLFHLYRGLARGDG